MRRIVLGSEEVPYELRRSPRRRTIGLRIGDAGLVVSVPSRLPQHAWEAVLREKSAWVLDKLSQLRSRALPPFAWRDGALLPFLGSSIELVVEEGGARARAVLDEGVLRVALADPTDTTALEARVVQWYRREAMAFFLRRVAVHARQLDVSVAALRLSGARTRWGSCTSRGTVRLNWRLVKAPPETIDYVVAHELAHLLQLNHSPAFWRIVAELCPDHALHRAFLKEQSAYYHLF